MEGSPNIVDLLHDGQVQLLINTPRGKESVYDDSYLRKAAIRYRVPYVTTPAAAVAAVEAISAARGRAAAVKCLQEYHREIETSRQERACSGLADLSTSSSHPRQP